MQKSIDRLERFFWMYLWINPVIDIVNGLFIAMLSYNFRAHTNEGGFALTPALLIRMCVLLLFVIYIFAIKDYKSVKIALPMGGAFILSVASEFINFGALGDRKSVV